MAASKEKATQSREIGLVWEPKQFNCVAIVIPRENI
jgi:hypothetical protein